MVPSFVTSGEDPDYMTQPGHGHSSSDSSDESYPATVANLMSDVIGFDLIFPELILGIGLALLIGNGLAMWKHRRGERPEGVQGEFRPGRVWFLMAVGVLMAIWGGVSVFS